MVLYMNQEDIQVCDISPGSYGITIFHVLRYDMTQNATSLWNKKEI